MPIVLCFGIMKITFTFPAEALQRSNEVIFTRTALTIEPRFSSDKGGENGLASFAEAPALSLSEKFDVIAARILIDGQLFNVAALDETFGKEWEEQEAIAVKVGGEIPTRLKNQAVADYLLDREALYLLSREQAGNITKEQAALLSKHRKKWKEDEPDAKDRAEKAGQLTDKEAALLNAYRINLINDQEGAVVVDGVTVNNVDSSGYPPYPFLGALIMRQVDG